MLQRHARIHKARKQANKRRTAGWAEDQSATELLAQAHGVAKFERLLSRHRRTRQVMFETYLQVLTAYELPRLMEEDAVLVRSGYASSLQAGMIPYQGGVTTLGLRVELAGRDDSILGWGHRGPTSHLHA